MDARFEERNAYKFRLPQIYNFKYGTYEDSDYWLSDTEEVLFKLRRRIHLGEVKYGCPVCKTPALLSRSKLGNWFFRHKKREEGVKCALVDEYMDRTERNIQLYNAKKETEEHKFLKKFIYDFLQYDSKVIGIPKVEKIYRSKAASTSWKKPDVSCKYGNRDIVFEIQLSNTWLSDVVAREEFYTDNQTSIVWVFNSFDSCIPSKEITKADIFYNNPEVNLFVLDEDAIDKSKQSQQLTLNCYYRIPKLDEITESINDEWYSKFVTISDFEYDSNTYRPYVISYNDKKEKAINRLEKIRTDRKRKSNFYPVRTPVTEKTPIISVPQKIQDLEPELTPIILKPRIEERCPKEFAQMTPKDCVDLIFGETYRSRNINSIRNRILDLKLEGFKLPDDIIEIMVSRNWIKKMEGMLSLMQYERIE